MLEKPPMQKALKSEHAQNVCPTVKPLSMIATVWSKGLITRRVERVRASMQGLMTAPLGGG